MQEGKHANPKLRRFDMPQTNPTTAPPDIDTRLQWAALHRAGYQDSPDLSFLVDALMHTDVQIWSYAQRILRRIVPMAAMYERWKSSTVERREPNDALPEWIRKRCSDWGKEGDFNAVCANKLAAESRSGQQLLMERLAPLYGAERTIAARLLDAGHDELATRFTAGIQDFLEKQFPRQLTIIPTMACQLKCRYCYSAGMPQTQFNTMEEKDLYRLLDWARNGGITRICLAGGEPTIYRHLDGFLDYVAHYGMEYFLSTNGLYSPKVSEHLLAIRPLSVSLHINPEIYHTKRREQFIDNTRTLAKSGIMTALRFNLTSASSEEYYDYLDLCEETGVKQIRLAVPVPNAGRSNTFVSLNRDELNAYGATLDRFTAAGRERMIEVSLSKPFPPCLLAEETAAVFLENGSYNASCQVHLQRGTHNMTVYPDRRFSACLSLNRQSNRSIMAYEDFFQAAATYGAELGRLSSIPLMDQCRSCPLADGGRCIGACLSYRADNESRPGTVGESIK